MLSTASLQQQNIPQLLFNIVYGSICVSPLFGGEYTGIVAGIAYLQFLLISKHRKPDLVVKICTIGFILSAAATAILAVVHWDVMRSGMGDPIFTLKNVGWFAIAFMLIDAVRFQVAYYKINIENFAKWLLIITCLSLALKIAFLNFFAGVSFSQFFQASRREIALFDLNPNHIDNILVSLLIGISWATIVYWQKLKTNYYMLAIIIAFSAFLIFSFLVTNSRAGIIGIGLSLFVIFVLAARMQQFSLKKIVVILCLLTASLIFLPDRITTGINSASVQVVEIAKSLLGSDSPENHSSINRNKLRLKVIDALENRPNDISKASALSKVCSDDQLTSTNQNLQHDTSTTHRFLLIVDGLKIWKEKLYFGHGSYDRNEYFDAPYNIDICRIAYFSHLHNYYLDAAIRGGVFTISMFTALSLILLYLLKLSFTYSNKNWMQPLPVLAFFPYLYFENFFDLSFNRNSDVSAVLFMISILLSINLQNRKAWSDMLHDNQTTPSTFKETL